ncbi:MULTISPECIES: hypothetical protein [unclassified Agarivorans]|uniref:hypothetical protein n=1 Tax=unclassified Agarivorans TaxID=2636026 RepID=UPI003D7E3D98
MSKVLLIGLILSATSLSSYAKNDRVLIIDFLLDEVEICSSEFDCIDVAKSSLPDATKQAIPVKKYDKKEGMLMFEDDGEEKWVHITEVELNMKAIASVTCTATTISKASDKVTFASFGLGEGC